MRWIKAVLFGGLSGLAGLWVLNLLQPYTGIAAPICMLHILICSIGGLPGTAMLLLLPLVL